MASGLFRRVSGMIRGERSAPAASSSSQVLPADSDIRKIQEVSLAIMRDKATRLPMVLAKFLEAKMSHDDLPEDIRERIKVACYVVPAATIMELGEEDNPSKQKIHALKTFFITSKILCKTLLVSEDEELQSYNYSILVKELNKYVFHEHAANCLIRLIKNRERFCELDFSEVKDEILLTHIDVLIHAKLNGELPNIRSMKFHADQFSTSAGMINCSEVLQRLILIDAIADQSDARFANVKLIKPDSKTINASQIQIITPDP